MILFGLATLMVLGLALWGYRLSLNPAVLIVAVVLCVAWSLTVVLPAKSYPGVDLACLAGLALSGNRQWPTLVVGFCFLGQLSAHALYLWVPPQLDFNAYARILDWGYVVQLVAAGAFGGRYVLDDVRRRMSDRGRVDLGVRT